VEQAGQTGQTGKLGTISKRQYHYDRGGQLTSIVDQTRGTLEYRYDPVGQLIAANSRMGREVFQFDPAGNLLDRQSTDYEASMAAHQPQRNHLLDNLLRHYAGTHYVYDKVGNMVQKNVGGLKESIERTQETPDAVYSQQVKRNTEIRFHGGTTTYYHWDSLNRLSHVQT
jgi:YD repeat-containing protein